MTDPATETPVEITRVLGLEEPSGGRLPRAWIWGALAAALGIAFVGLGLRWLAAGGASADRYVLAPVERRNLEIAVSATGRLEPTEQVDVSSELSGIVRQVLVEPNDAVRKGQSLAELDTERLEAEIAQARAALARARAGVRQAEASLREAEHEVERTIQLFESTTATARELEQAQATYARAQAGLEIARADVSVAAATLAVRETDLQKTCICSPIDGVVLTRNVDPGQTVASTLQAPVLFTVAEDLTQMELQVDIDEADVSLVHAGQTARFAVDAYPHREFPGRITKVRLAPDTSAGVVTYKAHLEVANPDRLLRPGMTATAEITARSIPDARVVPNEALRFEPPAEPSPEADRGILGRIVPHRPGARRSASVDAGPRVWVLDNAGEPVAVPIVVGLSDGLHTEVVEGDLDVGQQVVVDLRDAP